MLLDHFVIEEVFLLQPLIADMRKVLAKHPQVEQQRLHRRVFFDQIDPENQSLMVSFQFSEQLVVLRFESNPIPDNIVGTCADFDFLLREDFSF